MALMSFLDTIPECTDVDWNTWDMQRLIDATNAKTPGRITPVMEAQLIKVELDLGEHCQHWFNKLCSWYFLKRFQIRQFLTILIHQPILFPFLEP